MMSEHTPGPWHVGGTRDLNHIVYDFDSCSIAMCRQVYKQNPEECQANARLIAAAPNLLNSLAKFVFIDDIDKSGKSLVSNQGQGMDGYSKLANYDSLVGKARVIIAEATGDAPPPKEPVMKQEEIIHHDNFTKEEAKELLSRAHLMAAAPEMLSALEELAKMGEEGMKPDYNEWLCFHDKVAQVARDAIAKATERTSS